MNPSKTVFANFEVTSWPDPMISCDMLVFKELENGNTDMEAIGQIRAVDPIDFLKLLAELEAKDRYTLMEKFRETPILIANGGGKGQNSRAKGKRKKPMHEKIPTPRELRLAMKPKMDDGLDLDEFDTRPGTDDE
jgi:hypothetical protein